MSTTLIQRNLWKKLQGKKYRHSFISSQIGANVAAQIASTRVARGWTQKELAKRAKMSQVRISVLEDPNYENFSIKTLKRIAEAFDTAIILKFAPFSEMLGWLTTLRAENLAVPKFEEDSLKIEDVKPLPSSIDVSGRGLRDQSYSSAAVSASPSHQNELPLSRLADDSRPWLLGAQDIQQSAGRVQCGL